MQNNTIQFIKDYNDLTDFDDFNENSKYRQGKTVIMYFKDENNDNFIKFL